MAVRIGEVARRTGLSIHTVRFYERKGLLPPAARGPSNYREFTPRTLERLDFIRQAQDLGFTLAEIRECLLARTLAGGCDALRARGEQKLREIDAEIRRLAAVKTGIEKLLNGCTTSPPCNVVIALEKLRP
jgi:MerR family transcriptional regulator, copper efflux regulator